MSISDELISRLSSETGRRLLQAARAGRRRAVATISKCCVVITDDGYETREAIFAAPPTLAQLSERVGGDAFVVSVKMRRISRRERDRFQIAAE